MRSDFAKFFQVDGAPLMNIDTEHLDFGHVEVPIRNGIPRFTPDESYSKGNFSVLRERHATLQLDSINHTTDRRDTILSRTGWPQDFWQGKMVLECGTGAGADTEWLLRWGAKVISADLTGVDVAKRNLGSTETLCLIQASITNLPLHPKSFDVVFCHRVLQHTPNPAGTLSHILNFVKPDGHTFVHSYARTFFQMFRWKYALRPITTRMSPEQLYQIIKRSAPYLYPITTTLNRTLLGRYLSYVFIPFCNYRHHAQFSMQSDNWIIEYGIHDTFDALSPPYDSPISAKSMEAIGAKMLLRDFEVVRNRGMSLLRTRVR